MDYTDSPTRGFLTGLLLSRGTKYTFLRCGNCSALIGNFICILRFTRRKLQSECFAFSQNQLNEAMKYGVAHWAESDYGLSAGQHAVLPEGKGKRPWNMGLEHLLPGLILTHLIAFSMCTCLSLSLRGGKCIVVSLNYNILYRVGMLVSLLWFVMM